MSRKRRYQPRIFAGRVIMPDEPERIHKEILKFERIEPVSDEMRELIESEWLELVSKLPPKTEEGGGSPARAVAVRRVTKPGTPSSRGASTTWRKAEREA